jgi:hypothetical protein
MAGDVLSTFKPVNQLLSSNYPKVNIPLNLAGRRSRRVGYSLLEVVTISKDEQLDWRLKLEGISITRQFKPTMSTYMENENLIVSKFIYDITSILNAPEVLGRETLNFVIKHEGGPPLRVLSVLLDVIVEDQEAFTVYEHYSGIKMLDANSVVTIKPDSDLDDVVWRLIGYSPKKSAIIISYEGEKFHFEIGQDVVEEHSFRARKVGEVRVELANKLAKSPVFLFGLTLFHNRVKEPSLEITRYNVVSKESATKLILGIRNVGESTPDKLIITAIYRGMPLTTIVESDPKLTPGKEVEKTVTIPTRQILRGGFVIRLIWLKGPRRWVKDWTL